MAIADSSGSQPSYEDFQRDYWAPDREQVLASMAPNGDGTAYKGGSQTFNEASPSGESPRTFDPSKASPTTGINGGGGALTTSQGAPPGVDGAPAAPAAPLWQQPASPTYAPMEGVDVGKLNDPTHNSPKYVAARILASGGSVQQAAQAVGGTPIDATRFRLPTGEIIDTRRDEEGANALQWLVVGGDGAGAPSGAGAAGAAGSASGSTGGMAPGGAPQNSAFSDQVRQVLMQQLGGLTGPVNANDPAIKAEMDAQTAGADRLRREQRASDAERAAMNGLLNGGQSSGSFEQNVASGFENEQQQLAGVRAQLFTREIQSRRTQVAQLLNMALQSGDAESARNLQYQLALMDDAIRRMTLQQNQSQFNDTFGLNAAQFQYGKDRDLARYGAGY